MTRKIPVTILTGFLGSGKTTLLTNIIKNANGKRIAVIVNEFGEIGIDGEILRTSCGCEEGYIMELNNGCLCCTVQEEFLPTMLELMERKDSIDHIVIETSGLALPKPLLKAVNWPDLKPHITIDSVITVVDAVGIATGEICDREKVQAQRLADDSLDHESPIEELFEDQLSCADLVIISKADLVDAVQLEEIKRVVGKELRTSVKVITSEGTGIANDVLLGLNAEAENDLDNRHSHHEEDHANGIDHDHDDDINSLIVEVDAPHTPEQLVATLKELVATYEIYRIKGFINVAGKPMRMVLQGVGDRFTTYFDRKWNETEVKKTQLVVIGHDIEDIDIQKWINENLKVSA